MQRAGSLCTLSQPVQPRWASSLKADRPMWGGRRGRSQDSGIPQTQAVGLPSTAGAARMHSRPHPTWALGWQVRPGAQCFRPVYDAGAVQSAGLVYPQTATSAVVDVVAPR